MSLCFCKHPAFSQVQAGGDRQQGKLEERVGSHVSDPWAYLQPTQSWVHSEHLTNPVEWIQE